MSDLRHMLLSTPKRYREITVDGATVRVQSLTEGQRSRADLASVKDPATANAWFIRYSVVDEDGDCLFGDEDIPALQEMDCRTSQALIQSIAEFNAPPEDLETLVKN